MASHEVVWIFLRGKTRNSWTVDYDTVEEMVKNDFNSGHVQLTSDSSSQPPVASFVYIDKKVYIRLLPDNKIYLLERRGGSLWLTDKSPEGLPSSSAFD